MSISFQLSRPYPHLDCGICKEPLIKEVVIHNDNGEKHPLHEKCVREWMKINPSCPMCKVSIDPSSLFSWQDKIVSCWNRCKNYNNRLAGQRAEILAGIGTGIFLGALGAIESVEGVSGKPVLEIRLIKLALAAIPATAAGITAASLARIENGEAALLASSLVTYMLYSVT